MKDPYKIYPCGDSAVTLELADCINRETNQKVIAVYDWLRQHPFTGFRDAVIAYSALTVHYDLTQILAREQPRSGCADWVREKIIEAYLQADSLQGAVSRHHQVPVCYDPEFGIDLANVSVEKGLSIQEIIHWHCTPVYRIYMIGFLPGFPYMGEVPDLLTTARKAKPVPVVAGSVAIAGKQTGIYPLASPGGWHVLGRTPVKLFDPHAANPVPFKPGDEVSFYPVSRKEFENIYTHVNPGA